MADTTVIGPFSQTLFLGASIIGFQASIGWNSDQGRLSVELVEDPCRGTKVFYNSYGLPQITSQPDFFNPPKVGTAVYFRFGNFSFGGIVQNWEENKDVNGGKTYSVNIVDPIEVLEGSQVIINNYTGSVFGVPNLINAFGYMESLQNACNTSAYLSTANPPLGYTPANGWGGADVAEDGMSWFQIRDAIQTLCNVNGNIYGQCLQLRDDYYYLDISELPVFDINYRFSGDSLSILQLISEVCQSAGMDYFFETLYFAPPWVDPGYGGIGGLLSPDVWKFIKVRVVPRYTQRYSAYNVDLTVGSPVDLRLAFGEITNFIGNGGGKNRISRGLELRHDVTNSFLVGDNRQDLWQQSYSGSYDGYSDTIWPFWGVNADTNFPVIGNGINNEHTFTVSTLGLNDRIRSATGPTYTITVEELRTAAEGLEGWSIWMETNKNSITQALGFDGAVNFDFVINTAADKAIPLDAMATDKDKIDLAHEHARELEKEQDKQKLYDFVRNYAEMMGRKFMVALPVVCCAQDNSAPYARKLNWSPSDGAWTEANIQLNPVATALAPDSPYVEFMRREDGRIQAFVYYNTGGPEIDYTKCSPEDVAPISDTQCYVKATVEEIVFLNPTACTYPRAVISVDNPIYIKGDPAELTIPIYDFLAKAVGVSDADISALAQKVGYDKLYFTMSEMPLLPLGAAVPLLSNNLSYGPWVTTLSFGPAAKTKFERDNSLNPWSFGNAQNMNYAGQIKVETEVTEQVVSEAGGFTIPGAPPGRLGDILLNNGPEITNIETQVDPRGGVTTSVRMRTWVANFGELGRRKIQALRQSGSFQFKLQRAFIRRRVYLINQARLFGGRGVARGDRFTRNSSHEVIVAQYVTDFENTNWKRSNVSITDLRKVVGEMYDDYDSKALMSLNGLFRPFSVSDNAGLPSFSNVTPTASLPVTDKALNPFKNSEDYYGTSEGHDIDILTRGTTTADITDLNVRKDANGYGSNEIRGIGLRAPLVLVGWGYDANDKPVPNKTPNSPGDEFADDYLSKPHTWKAGPLDCRWDDETGTWQATGGTNVRVRLINRLNQNSFASGNIIRHNGTDQVTTPQQLVRIYDALLNAGDSLDAGTTVIASKMKGCGSRLYALSAGCGTNSINTQ